MAYQMKSTFLTEVDEQSSPQANSPARQPSTATVDNVTIDLASATKMAFDLFVEAGVGTEKDNNRRRKRRAYQQVYDPAKEKYYGQWGSTEHEDSLEKLVGSKIISSKPVNAPKPPNAGLTQTETKFSQDNHKNFQNHQRAAFQPQTLKPQAQQAAPRGGNIANREMSAESREQPKKEILFTRTGRRAQGDSLSPPKPSDTLGLNLEARPNEGQKRNGAVKAPI